MFGTSVRYFSPEGCRLKYSWFSRYGRIPAPKDSLGRFNRGTPNGYSGRTVRDRVGNASRETFLAARRNFSPEGCRLKYSWFSRYGRIPAPKDSPGRSTEGTPNGSSGRTVRDRVGNARGETFLAGRRNFSPEGCRLKYAWFSRYGRIPAPKDSPGRFNRGTPNGCIGRTVRDRVGNGQSYLYKRISMASSL